MMLSITMFTIPSFAIAHKHNNDCPPISQIRNIPFANARTIWNDKTLWAFNSNIFEYGQHQWEVVFVTRIHASDEEEALRLGQDYFTNHVTLHHPKEVVLPAGIICEYADTSSSSHDGGYSVLVNTPIH